MLLAGGVPSLLFPSLEPSSWRFAKSQEVGSSASHRRWGPRLIPNALLHFNNW